ncbi:MAG: TolC family protein [Bryobacteraceae bacterium]|jgi:HAE1 family hydrophobic/amphiphilic exporter-1
MKLIRSVTVAAQLFAFGQAVQMEPLKEVELQPRVGILTETTITLPEVIERVLANDRDLAISRIEREEAGYNVSAAKGVYDPVVGLKAYRTRQMVPVASILGGSASGRLSQTELNATPQLSGLSPWLGGSYSLAFANSRQQNDSLFNTFNPQYATAVSLNLAQPLWRGLRFDENRHRLQVARRNQQLSVQQLRQRTIQIVTQAVQAYWELDYAWHNLQVQTEAVRLAERQYASNRRLADQGILAPVDVVAAQTQVATFQQLVFGAQQVLTQAENNLKSLMLANRDDLLWSAALIPSTEVKTDVTPPALAAAVKQALQSRPELAETALGIEVNKLDARLSRELVRPRVDAFANLTVAGLAGQPVPGTNPLAPFFPPGTVLIPPLLIGGYGASLSNLAGGNFPTAQVGLQVSLPLRNRTAEAQEAISAAEGRRLRALQDQVGMAIEADVRNALQAVQSARSRLDAASLARRSAEEQYASEQRQFQAGTSTVFLVLQRQTDFIAARSREVRSRADLGEAIANLDRATAGTLEAHGIAFAER